MTSNTKSLTTIFAIIPWFVLTLWAHGVDALAGAARLSGPLQGCQVVMTGDSTGVFNGTTDANGSFNASVPGFEDAVFRVVVNPGSLCRDTFTNFTLPFQLSAALPANATNGTVDYGSFMSLSYLELLDFNASSNATSSGGISNSSSSSNRTPNNITVVRQNVQDLYATFNISFASFQLDPLQLQPLGMVQSTNTTIRSLGVAILAADVEMGALITLGAALLNASAGGGNGTAAAANGTARMVALARAVAAEGMRQLLIVEAQRQALAADAAALALARNISLAAGSSNTLPDSAAVSSSPAPPSPPAPPPAPTPASIKGLESMDVVLTVLVEAARRMNVTVADYAMNATAAVVAGMAAYAEVAKDAALVQVSGVPIGLNALNAVLTMSRLTAVQADAAAQMTALVGPNPQALATYVLDALPERISKATVNVATIHTTLGLAAPGRPVPCGGVAHVVGPLSGCQGQANDVWTPRYEAFVTSSSGAFTLLAKGQGTATVTPYRYCQDTLTTLQLSMSVSNLGPAMDAVSVSPVAMLAQGLYSLQAAQRLTTITMAQQTAAFAAMGLNLTAYNAVMVAPPPAGNSTAANSTSNSTSSPSGSAASPPPATLANATLSNTTVQPFNLSQPLMGAVIAANSAIVGLMYSTRALFASSCQYAYELVSTETANSFTTTLTSYALAMEAAASPGGVLNLTAPARLENIFNFVATACYFNSTAELAGTVTSHVTGTFLSGGSASAIGAAAAASGDNGRHRHHHRRRLQLATGPFPRLFSDPYLETSLGTATIRRLAADMVSRGVMAPPALLLLRQRPEPQPYEPDVVSSIGSAGHLPGTVDPDPGAADPDPGAADPDPGAADPDPRAAARLSSDLDGSCLGNCDGAGASSSSSSEGADAEQSERARQQQRVTPRVLTVYVDDEDMSIVYSKVAEVLAGINTRLQAVQNKSKSAAAAASLAGFNLTELVVNATQLGYVGQQSLYVELSKAMSASYSNGLNLVMAIQNLSARFKGEALTQRMEEAPINTALICSAAGAQCASSTSSPPPPLSGGSTSGKKKSNTALYVGIGVGIGLGVVAAVLLTWWLVWRALRKRQVTQAVVKTFHQGDMHSMPLRLPSTLPLEGNQFKRQSQAMDNYHSLVPAALGSDPTVATDYPLYPGQYKSTQLNSSLNTTYRNTMMASTAATAASGPVPAGTAPLNISLPPPRFPTPGAAGGGSQGGPHSGTMQQPQQSRQQGHQGQQQDPALVTQQRAAPAGPPSQQLMSSMGPFTKTYANAAYVTADAADAAAQRGNFNGGDSLNRGRLNQTGSYHGQHATGAAGGRISEVTPAGGRSSLQLHQQQRPPVGPPRAPGAQAGGGDSGGGGISGGQLNSSLPHGGLNSTLNGTMGGRRTGLPPLASYTSVTNTAAPTAALNASLRTIPVNTAFNSSLRPPPSHALHSQSGRQSDRS